MISLGKNLDPLLPFFCVRKKQGMSRLLMFGQNILFSICFCSPCLVLFWPGPLISQSAAKEFADLAGEIGSLAEKTRQETILTRQLLQKDQKVLQERFATLKEELSRQEGLLSEKKKRLTALKQKEKGFLKGLAQEQQEIKAIQGIVRDAAEKLEARLQESPLGPGFFVDRDRLKTLLASDRLPGMSEIQALVNTCFKYIEDSGKIIRYQGTFQSADGRESTGEIVRFGGLTAIYSSGQEVGYLQPGPRGDLLARVPGKPSWSVRRSLQAYLDQKQEHLPLDISGGTVFKRLSREKSWKEWIQSGGLLVWPIFAIAGLALVLVLERLFFILRIRSNSDRIMRTITELAAGDNWEACRAYCSKNSKYPTCQVISKLLANMGQGRQVLENGLQEGLFQQIPRLERFLPTLNVLAAIAPLIGLLGTVTGMISTFQVITIFGSGDPKLMAGGISEALITTQLGLLVAVPILFVHHLLDRRADKILGDIEEKGTGFSLLLLKKENQAPGLSPRSVGLKTQTAARQESA